MTMIWANKVKSLTIQKMKYDPFLLSKLNFAESNHNWQWFIKRSIDIIGSLIGIIVISPLLLLIAMAIKLESKGSIIFKQTRVGLKGKRFEYV